MFFSITSSEKFRFLSLILNVFNIDLHIGALPFFLFCLVANNYRGNCAIFVFKHKIGLMILVISPIYYRALFVMVRKTFNDRLEFSCKRSKIIRVKFIDSY